MLTPLSPKPNLMTWITVAAILGLTTLLTVSITVGSKINHKKLIQKHNKGNYDDIIIVTSEVQSENYISRNYIPMEIKIKSSLVFWKIIHPHLANQQEH